MNKRNFVLIWMSFLAACTPSSFIGSAQNSDGAFASNGQQIYFTATSNRGTPISYTGGPATGGMMMSGNLTCAACHGSDGRGGQVTIMMQVINAPDIRWSALLDMAKEDLHNSDAVYDPAMFKQAIEQGQDPAGDALDSAMPRWSMSDQDVSDLVQFLKSLP